MLTYSLFRPITVASLVWAVSSPAVGALFSLEFVEPAVQIGDIGTLRVIYDGGDEDLSFAVGGLDLKLSSSSPGVMQFLDANIVNDENRWDVHTTGGIAGNEISRLFAASLFAPGLSGNGPQTFAEIKYRVTGPGFTNLLVDVGAEDPLVQGDLGDVSHHVFSRGACLGDCLPNNTPPQINLGESWERLREELNSRPVPHPQLQTHGIYHSVQNPGQHEPVLQEPALPIATEPGLFSLEVIEPASQIGDQGKIRVMYHGGSENYDFANGGVGLKLTSSNPGVIKFSDAQILNPDDRWSIATARGISDDSVAEMLAFSVLTPGLSGTGSQVFAEIEYSLLGTGFTDLVLDIQGEDPLVDGDFGDVSRNLRSLGACLGDCLPGIQPQQLNLGESWARLREQMFPAPQLPSHPPVNPDVVQPVLPDPIAEEPTWTEPVPIDPVGTIPAPTDPIFEQPDSDEHNPVIESPVDIIEITPIDITEFPFWNHWADFSLANGLVSVAVNGRSPLPLGSVSLRQFVDTEGFEPFATPMQSAVGHLVDLIAAKETLLNNADNLAMMSADGSAFWILNSSVARVPEPCSLTLMVAAISGCLVHRFRWL